MTNTGLDDAIEQRIAAVAAQEASRALAEAQMSTLQVRQQAPLASCSTPTPGPRPGVFHASISQAHLLP